MKEPLKMIQNFIPNLKHRLRPKFQPKWWDEIVRVEN